MARAQKTPQQRIKERNNYVKNLSYGAIAAGGGDENVLSHLGATVLHCLEAEEQLYKAVGAARASGHTWNQIAAVLGVSRQAATEKFDTE